MSKLISALLIALVRVYQYTLSPFLGANCRYHPGCSAYMVEAIQVWGPFKGTLLGLKRIGSCHPWGGSGYDPVPQKQKNSTADA